MKALNLVGERFGKLVVMSEGQGKRSTGGQKKRTWLCKCDCGGANEVKTELLRSGHTTSCGCVRSETCRNRNQSHNLSKHPEYSTWVNAKERVFGTNPKFHTYVGKGMYEPWITDAAAFIEYTISLPKYGQPGLSIDRIDNSIGYYPGNLRWATASEQQRNKG